MRRKLESHGFVVERALLIPRPTPLPTGMAGWLETFAMPFVAGLADGDRTAALAEVVELLRPVLCDADGEVDCGLCAIAGTGRTGGIAFASESFLTVVF